MKSSSCSSLYVTYYMNNLCITIVYEIKKMSGLQTYILVNWFCILAFKLKKIDLHWEQKIKSKLSKINCSLLFEAEFTE